MSTGPVSSRPVQLHRQRHVQGDDSGDAMPQPIVKSPSPFAAPSKRAYEHLSVPVGHVWYLPLKRGFDVVMSIFLLIVLSPVMVLGIVLVKVTSRGPALFRQVRLGINGRPFTL